MCTHPFAKEALTLHLARSEGHERYFGCNLMHCNVLASHHQHLMTEAPSCLPAPCLHDSSFIRVLISAFKARRELALENVEHRASAESLDAMRRSDD